MGSETILNVENLSTHFSTPDGTVKAVENVSFYLKKGEVVGVVGESGCGKSVTMMSLLQLIPSPPGKIVNGSVNFQGQDLLTLNHTQLQEIRGNKISVIFQDPMTSLNPYMRISMQIMEPLLIHRNMNKAQARTEVIKMMHMVGISDAEERVDCYPHEFSGGMRQRVMIAMALVCKPEILIADEPTTALDVSVQVQILKIIKDLAEQLGTAVVFITHDLGIIAHMCDRVYVMYAGRIVEEAPVYELFTNPSHPYTEGLLESITQLYEHTEGALKIIEGQPPILTNVPKVCMFAPRCKYVHEQCLQGQPKKIAIKDNHFVECVLHDATNPQGGSLGTK